VPIPAVRSSLRMAILALSLTCVTAQAHISHQEHSNNTDYPYPQVADGVATSQFVWKTTPPTTEYPVQPFYQMEE